VLSSTLQKIPHRREQSRDTSLLAGGKEQVRQTMMLSAQVMLVLPAGLGGAEGSL